MSGHIEVNNVELSLGLVGPQGAAGPTGPAGITGPTGPAGTNGTGGADLVVPVAIKDTNEDDFITFTRTGTGTARIATPQDDLSLRSARDITLIAGSDGPGNVYIGWGDATITPNATNRVATIADIQDANIADFVFTDNEGSSSITLPGDKGMRIEAGADSDLYLTAGDDLYIQTLGEGDDIHINAADDIIFTTNNEDFANEEISTWRMDSEGKFQLPGDGYISNPYAETYSEGIYTVSYSDNYLNNQSGLTQATAVFLPVEQNTLWFVDNNTFTSPVTITFADFTTVQTVAIYNATSQGTPAVIFQWNNQINKTYANTFPLRISVQYEQVSYGASTIELDPQWIGNDQKVVIDATGGQPGHIHVRAGGTIDESTADLILGGERNKVKISDTDRSVVVTTKPARIQNTYQNINQESNANFVAVMPVNIDEGTTVNVNGIDFLVTTVVTNTPDTGLATITATNASFVAGTSYTFTYEPDYENGWTFNSNGYLSGPAMGGLLVSGLFNGEGDLWVGSNTNIVLNSGEGQFLDASNNPDNQIATIGHVDTYKSIYSRVLASNGSPLTGALTHVGKLLYANLTETAAEFTVPTNATVAFPIGSEIKFATSDESPWHISAADYGTTTIWGEGSNGYSISNQTSFIVPQNSTATLLKVDTERWILSSLNLTD